MNLSAFLAENVEQVENEFYVASKRIKDENGNPIPWEIRCIPSAEVEALRESCMRRVPGKKNRMQREVDTAKFLVKFAVACTVFPNLNDAQLQDSYHVMSAEELLQTMLTPGEYTDYTQKVSAICGYEEEFSEVVEEAKN